MPRSPLLRDSGSERFLFASLSSPSRRWYVWDAIMTDPPTDSEETRHLLEQLAAGDRQAFERLFSQFRGELRQFIALRLDPRLRTRVDASDVVQETQLEVFQRLGDYLARRPMP